VVESNVRIYEIVQGLSDDFDLDAYFFWQPYIGAGNKRLTGEEEAMLTSEAMELAIDESLRVLVVETYRQAAVAASEYPRLHLIADVFDDVEESIWIDTWGHVTPIGNQIVAQRMLEFMTADSDLDQTLELSEDER
jgi:hypothetical protein